MRIRSKLCMVLGFSLGSIPASASPFGDNAVRLRVKDGFRLVIPVLINGQGPYDFLLDTGAAHTSIDGRIARKLQLKAQSQKQVVAYPGTPMVAVAAVRNLSVGPVWITDIDVLCFEVQELFSFGSGIHGILGQDFLSRFDYAISHRHRMIEFDKDGELGHTLQGARVQCKRHEGKFYIYTRTEDDEGHSQRYLIDSGTQYPVLFERPAQEFAILPHEPSLLLLTSAGHRRLQPCVITVLQFGDMILRNVRLMLADPLPGEQPFEDGLLPLSIFETIYFNNQNGYVILNPTWSPK